jgi:hypothetical protein
MRAIGRSLTAYPKVRSALPVGMLDVERITRVTPPVAHLLAPRLSTASTSPSTKV